MVFLFLFLHYRKAFKFCNKHVSLLFPFTIHPLCCKVSPYFLKLHSPQFEYCELELRECTLTQLITQLYTFDIKTWHNAVYGFTTKFANRSFIISDHPLVVEQNSNISTCVNCVCFTKNLLIYKFTIQTSSLAYYPSNPASRIKRLRFASRAIQSDFPYWLFTASENLVNLLGYYSLIQEEKWGRLLTFHLRYISLSYFHVGRLLHIFFFTVLSRLTILWSLEDSQFANNLNWKLASNPFSYM